MAELEPGDPLYGSVQVALDLAFHGQQVTRNFLVRPDQTIVADSELFRDEQCCSLLGVPICSENTTLVYFTLHNGPVAF